MNTGLNYDCGFQFVHLHALIASGFTGKERDNESGLDYFGARYYSSVIGRFSSPDWSASPEAVLYRAYKSSESVSQLDGQASMVLPRRLGLFG